MRWQWRPRGTRGQRSTNFEHLAPHGCSDNTDFFGGYMCLCDEASWSHPHVAEVLLARSDHEHDAGGCLDCGCSATPWSSRTPCTCREAKR